MKISAIRRALLLANIFNLLVALYFIIIAIVALVELRWYHQLTITVKVRYLLTSMTSYFAFFILIVAGLLLISIFVTGSLRIKPAKVYVGPSGEDAINDTQVIGTNVETTTTTTTTSQGNNTSMDPKRVASPINNNSNNNNNLQRSKRRLDTVGGRIGFRSQFANNRIVLRDSTIISETNDQTNTSVCCSILVHLITATCLVLILIIWLFNTGELVRDSISTQLEAAYNRYQFTNRSNYKTIAIDGMQDINDCCGSLDYTDFPHHPRSGLSNGQYPGSCCGKYTFGVNARPICTAEDVVRQRQTTGCTTVLANYYDLISLLVVPVALVSLFVNITIIALITIIKGAGGGHHHHHHYNNDEETTDGLEHLFYNQRTQRRAVGNRTIGHRTPIESKPVTTTTTTMMALDEATSRSIQGSTTNQLQATTATGPTRLPMPIGSATREDRLELKPLDMNQGDNS